MSKNSIMKINTTCPYCKQDAVSKLRKVTFLGLVIHCNSCEAELGVKFYSALLIVTFIIGVPLVKIYPWLSPLNIIGWVIIIVGSTLHMAKIPFFVRNIGAKNARKNP